MTESQRVAGTVRWFSGQKGFGFIAPDSGGEDVFVHQTSIQSDGFRTLYEGEAVEFVIDLAGDGRSKATDVIRIGGTRFSGGGRGGRSRGRGGRGRRGRFDDGYSGYGGGDYGRGGARIDGEGRRGRFDDGYSGYGGSDYGRGGATIDGEGRRGRFDDGYGGRGGGRINGGSGACYNCGRTGHLARDCYHNSGGGGRGYDGDLRGRGGYGSRRGRGGYVGGGGWGRFGGESGGEYTNISSTGGGPLTCYNCGEEGHFARGCPNVKIDNT